MAVTTTAETAARPPLRERLRREMAAEMLVAAEEVFAESGLAKAHVEDIAKKAGVAVGTLYNYYKDRDGLLAATLLSRAEELTAELQAVEARSVGRSARETMLALARTYVEFFQRRRTFIRILVEGELAQLSESYPTSATLPTQCWTSFKEAFRAAMERGVAQGELPQADAGLDLWLFLGLLRGVVMRDLRGGVPCRVTDADRAVNVFFDGATI